MKQKILCAIVSAVMVVGTLAGCGSTSKKVESTILTELTPGVSTAEDVKTYFKEHDLAYEKNDNDYPTGATTTDKFLGYETAYSPIYYLYDSKLQKDGNTIKEYYLYITFKNIDEYKQGVEKVKDYLTSISFEDSEEKDDCTKYMVRGKDNNKYMIYYYVKSYDDAPQDYYNTVIKLQCDIIEK
ncbi:hypothetical protein [Agathobacter sp.]